MANLHQPPSEELLGVARDLGRINPVLVPLEHQLRKGVFDEQLGPHLYQTLERYRESPEARKSIERLIQAISDSIRARIFQASQVAPSTPALPKSTESWMRLDPGLFAQYSLQLVSNATTVQTREQAEQMAQQLQFVLEIAYRRWRQQSPPLISGAVGQLQQALQHLQHRLESARRAAAQQGAPARHPSPSPEVPPAKAASQEAWSLADLSPGWQQKMQDMLIHHAQQFIDQVLAPALAHKYDELEYIARGGMGMVLKARQKLGDGKGRVVALKLNMQMSDREMIQSFMNEGANAAQLGFHPNVVAVIDSNQAQVQFGDLPVPVLIPYHVFEFVKGAKDGTSLAESMVEAEQSLPVEAALLLIQQAAKGLAAAHKKGIVHRDMKLENVLLPPDVQKLIKAWVKDRSHDPNKLRDGLQKISGLKVSDFGLAGVRSQQLQDIKSIEASEEIITDQHTLTGPNRVVGTAEYIPPEAYNDSSSAGKPWDVYSLGLVLYTLLTSDRHPLQYSKGVKPGKENIRSYYLKIGGDKTHSPAVASTEQDPNIKAFVQKDSRNKEVLGMLQRMTAYDPEERPTMEEVIDWVDQELERRSEKTVRMRRMKLTLGTIVPALIVGFGLYLANVRPQEHVAFGARRKALVADVNEVLKKPNLSSEALRAQLNRLKEMEVPKGYEAAGDEPMDSSVIELISRSEKMITTLQNVEWSLLEANRLISEGDKIIHHTLPNGDRDPTATFDFEGARKKYREAESTSNSISDIVQQKLKEVDRMESLSSYRKGLEAYHRGDVDTANSSFSITTGLGTTDLSEQDAAQLERFSQNLKHWPQTLARVESNAQAIFISASSVQEFTRELEQLLQQIQVQQSANAFSALIRLWGLFSAEANRLESRNNQGSLEQNAEYFKRHQTFLTKRRLLKTYLLSPETSPPVYNPGDLQLLANFSTSNSDLVMKKIDSLVGNREYASCNGWYLELFHSLNRFLSCMAQANTLDLSEEDTQIFVTTRITTIMNYAQTKFSPAQKLELAQIIQSQLQGTPIYRYLAPHLPR